MYRNAIILIIVIHQVFTDGNFSSISEPIVSNLNISYVLDDKRYIRVNISWEEIKVDVEYVSIYFSNSDGCSLLNDVQNYPLRNHYIIEPSMDLTDPADEVMNECSYNITLENKIYPYNRQSMNFTVPTCVSNRCKCEADSITLTDVTALSEGLLLISWNKSIEVNVTVIYISYYKEKDAQHIKTHISEEKLHMRKDAVEMPIGALKNGELYTITVEFMDQYKECTYTYSLDYTVPSEKRISIFVFCSILIILIILLLYVTSLYSSKVRKILDKHLSFLSTSYEQCENRDVSTSLTQIKIREEINAQYTPLEFVLKVHKFDEYEFPRNKIIMKEVIGEGAFGKVYYAMAYELEGTPDFTMVAVKQLREGAPEEEVLNFQAEIEILKRIGKHENIVKLLGCVTMEQPYMMIMEMVPCGCLKNYLLNLRKKWTERNNVQIFFPDDMDEHWLKPNHPKSNVDGQINYTSCIFDTSECSYIMPVNNFLRLPESSGSFEKRPVDGNDLNPVRYQYPHTPDSIQSSQTSPSSSSMISGRVPSSTETELTSLDMETPTSPTRKMNHTLEPVLDHTELQLFAFQIATGMSYLEKIPVTHRDLAARNILITSDKVLKISDFGMSRTGSYVNRTSKKIPLRWMAIESIEDQKWDSKSDVWSFGVVLWEIGTLGAFPYEHTNDILILPELKKGKRLERPKICTDELYSLMLRCWSEHPEKRPSFAELVEMLDVKKRKIYVEFSQLSPKYVFPPAINPNEGIDSKSVNKE